MKSVSQIINVVSSCIEKTYQWYKAATGSENVPFLNVAHDIWDSKEKEYLGVLIHFMIPFLRKCVSFPIGLQQAGSHKALDVVRDLDCITEICFLFTYLPSLFIISLN
jgi:hypothetical protein